MSLTRALVLFVPVVLAMQAGCDKDKETATISTASASATVAVAAIPSTPPRAAPSASAMASAAAPQHPRGDRRTGLEGILFHAVRELELKDDKKAAIEKLEEPLHADDPDLKSAIKLSHADLVAGLRAGKIDSAVMQKHYLASDKAAQARLDKEVAALNGLYAALDAPQRKALTAAVRAKQAEREARMAAHKQDAKDGGTDGGGPGDRTKHRLDRMTADLNLDPAQQKSITAVLAKGDSPATMDARRVEGKKRIDTLLTAFEQDAFDAKKLQLDSSPKKAHEGLERQVQAFAQILPVLRPDQREKLAAGMDHAAPAGARPRGERAGFPYEREELHDDPE